MKDWEYTFDPISKATWIQQIEADLRGKASESLHLEWWVGEPLNPILHHEDMSQTPVRLPGSLFNKPPEIVEWIECGSHQAGEINKRLLDALQYGAETIIVHTENSNESFKEEWINGVLMDIITFQIQLDDLPSNDGITKLNNLPEYVSIRINRKSTSEFSGFLEKINLTGLTILKKLQFNYTFQSHGNWVTMAAEMCNFILQDLEKWRKLGLSPISFLEKCIFSLEADQNYFKQIIQARVMHLLWQNLIQQYHEGGFQHSPYLETHVSSSPGEKPDHFLIRASMSSLAASLGGTHSLCIHHSYNSEIPEFYRRINRDIHHLLNFESNMYKGTDPMAGAYVFDFYTRKWTNDIWSKIV